jgi:hypothetical protein
VVNVTPRYAKLKGRADSREVIGWENIELIRCKHPRLAFCHAVLFQYSHTMMHHFGDGKLHGW